MGLCIGICVFCIILIACIVYYKESLREWCCDSDADRSVHEIRYTVEEPSKSEVLDSRNVDNIQHLLQHVMLIKLHRTENLDIQARTNLE